MKKVLRIITIITGIICAVSVCLLGYLCLEDIASLLGKIKAKLPWKGKAEGVSTYSED